MLRHWLTIRSVVQLKIQPVIGLLVLLIFSAGLTSGLIGCGKETQDQSNIEMAIPSELPALLPSDRDQQKMSQMATTAELKHVVVNLTGDGIASPIVFNWDADDSSASQGNFTLDAAGNRRLVFEAIPTGKSRLIQVLTIYSTESQSADFYYGDSLQDLWQAEEVVTINVQPIQAGVELKDSHIMGRYLTTADDGPFGEIAVKYQPPGKPGMLIEKAGIASGWFNVFGLENVPFTYEHVESGMVLFQNVTANSPEFSASNRVARVHVPTYLYSSDKDSFSYTNKSFSLILGFWGPGVGSHSTCYEPLTYTFRYLKDPTTQSLLTWQTSSVPLSSAATVSGGVPYTMPGVCQDETRQFTEALFADPHRLEGGGSREGFGGFRGPFKAMPRYNSAGESEGETWAIVNGGNPVGSDSTTMSLEFQLLPGVERYVRGVDVYVYRPPATNMNQYPNLKNSPCNDLARGVISNFSRMGSASVSADGKVILTGDKDTSIKQIYLCTQGPASQGAKFDVCELGFCNYSEPNTGSGSGTPMPYPTGNISLTPYPTGSTTPWPYPTGSTMPTPGAVAKIQLTMAPNSNPVYVPGQCVTLRAFALNNQNYEMQNHPPIGLRVKNLASANSADSFFKVFNNHSGSCSETGGMDSITIDSGMNYREFSVYIPVGMSTNPLILTPIITNDTSLTPSPSLESVSLNKRYTSDKKINFESPMGIYAGMCYESKIHLSSYAPNSPAITIGAALPITISVAASTGSANINYFGVYSNSNCSTSLASQSVGVFTTSMDASTSEKTVYIKGLENTNPNTSSTYGFYNLQISTDDTNIDSASRSVNVDFGPDHNIANKMYHSESYQPGGDSTCRQFSLELVSEFTTPYYGSVRIVPETNIPFEASIENGQSTIMGGTFYNSPDCETATEFPDYTVPTQPQTFVYEAGDQRKIISYRAPGNLNGVSLVIRKNGQEFMRRSNITFQGDFSIEASEWISRDNCVSVNLYKSPSVSINYEVTALGDNTTPTGQLYSSMYSCSMNYASSPSVTIWSGGWTNPGGSSNVLTYPLYYRAPSISYSQITFRAFTVGTNNLKGSYVSNLYHSANTELCRNQMVTSSPGVYDFICKCSSGYAWSKADLACISSSINPACSQKIINPNNSCSELGILEVSTPASATMTPGTCASFTITSPMTQNVRIEAHDKSNNMMTIPALYSGNTCSPNSPVSNLSLSLSAQTPTTFSAKRTTAGELHIPIMPSTSSGLEQKYWDGYYSWSYPLTISPGMSFPTTDQCIYLYLNKPSWMSATDLDFYAFDSSGTKTGNFFTDYSACISYTNPSVTFNHISTGSLSWSDYTTHLGTNNLYFKPTSAGSISFVAYSVSSTASTDIYGTRSITVTTPSPQFSFSGYWWGTANKCVGPYTLTRTGGPSSFSVSVDDQGAGGGGFYSSTDCTTGSISAPISLSTGTPSISFYYKASASLAATVNLKAVETTDSTNYRPLYLYVDDLAPYAPDNISYLPATTSSISVSPNISWTTATDNGGSGIHHYEVLINDADNESTPIRNWTDVGLVNTITIGGLTLTCDTTNPTQYFALVRAVDYAGNVSGFLTYSANSGWYVEPCP